MVQASFDYPVALSTLTASMHPGQRGHERLRSEPRCQLCRLVGAEHTGGSVDHVPEGDGGAVHVDRQQEQRERWLMTSTGPWQVDSGDKAAKSFWRRCTARTGCG